jgi:hypothetical protein
MGFTLTAELLLTESDSAEPASAKSTIKHRKAAIALVLVQ